jgi:DNA-binding transcriptional LysR family regulator
MFDWNDLRHFLAVARCGSTVAAAKALNVNQSTVHRRLDELEKQLGRQLVVRQPTGYKLTELGQDIVTYAERVEEAVHQP